MWKIIEKFQADFLDALINDWLVFLQEHFGNLSQTIFFIESLVDSVLSPVARVSAYEVIYFYCSMLLVIKLLWKGWNVYVLWSNGSPDVSPGELLKGAGWAIIITVAFPTAYEIGVSIAMEVVNTVLGYFKLPIIGADGIGGETMEQLGAAIYNLTSAGGFIILMSIVYLILLILLWLRVLAQGAELFIFRLGIPIAAVGLVDSDGGAWTNYIQTLFKQVFTVMFQYFCIVLGIKVIALGTTSALAVGIAFEVTAFAAPRLLSQVLIPKGGGGMMHSAYTLSMVVRTFAK